MDKRINYATLFSSVALFVFTFGSTFSGTAFAAIDNSGHYTYTDATVVTDPHLVCGDHMCQPGEITGDLSVIENGAVIK